jgi:hypothetical protein
MVSGRMPDFNRPEKMILMVPALAELNRTL